MPRSDDLLYDELRAGFTTLALAAPTHADVARARAGGRRAARLRMLTIATPVSALLVAAAVAVAVMPHSGSATIGASIVPTPTAASVETSVTAGTTGVEPSVGRVGDYVATYLPDTTVKPVRSDPLMFDGGRCDEIAGSASATSGCWSPAECQADQDITTSGPCNVGLELTFSSNDRFFREQKVGSSSGPPQRSVTAVSVNGSPGFLDDQLGFFNDVTWRLADGRVASARGANFSATDMLAFANGIQYRPAPDAPVATPASSPPAATPPAATPTAVAVDAVDARPATAPPSVPDLRLPQEGSAKAVAGNGWYLGINQGNSRGAASVAVGDGAGHDHSSAFVYSQLEGDDGRDTPIPLKGLLAVTVADFDTAGAHHLVVSGAVPRGTTGVGVLDSSGHRGWATLVDPGAAFDTLFFAYEPPIDAAVAGLQSFGTAGPTGAQLPPFPTYYPTDPTAPAQVHRLPGAPVVVGGVTVGGIPAGVTIDTAPCTAGNATPTQACWSGKITDPGAARAAQRQFGVADLLLDVQVKPGASNNLTGLPGTTAETVRGVQVTELDQGPAVLLRFRLPNGKAAFIRGINLPRSAVLAVAGSLIG